MSQNWFRPHPYGIYPRGNAKSVEDFNTPRLGSLSPLQFAMKGEIHRNYITSTEPTEEAFLELMLHLLSFVSVNDLCQLSATCTGWYCCIHASDAFKQAHDIISPNYLRFRRSWKETAIRSFINNLKNNLTIKSKKRSRTDDNNTFSSLVVDNIKFKHHPIAVKRAFFNDQLFQAWMCTILPCHYHLRPVISNNPNNNNITNDGAVPDGSILFDTSKGAAWTHKNEILQQSKQFYRSSLKEVPRCSGLSPEEFRKKFEEPNLPVVLTDIATKWPLFHLLEGNFKNLSNKARDLFRSEISPDIPMRCEHTMMNVTDYVHYALEQSDERPIYMFDAEFGNSMMLESLYTVPDHFGCDDFFKVLGKSRPKYRWIIAGPKRGGSSFHVDPNYTNAWNANLTGRKRWILFPPGCTPSGVFPSNDMSEVTTPVSLTEWLLNHYDNSVEQWRGVGYECICEPGDIMFIPCGWWHFVINLEDSIAITQNYVSESNLLSVMKFLSAMKSSISGINEDADNISGEMVEKRRANFAEEFASAMRLSFPDVMQRVEMKLAQESEQRLQKNKECVALPLLNSDEEGFTFNF